MGGWMEGRDRVLASELTRSGETFEEEKSITLIGFVWSEGVHCAAG